MNNLKLPLVAANQSQKELTINDQALALDAAFSEILDVDFTEGSQVLDGSQFTRNFTFNCISLDDDSTLTVQPVKRLFSVQNSSDYEVTVDVLNESGDTVVVEPGEMAILHCDGTNVRTAIAGGQVQGVGDVDEEGFYVRIEGEWVEVEAGDNVSLSLDDGKLVISSTGGGEGGGISDAPDNKPHVRAQGEWISLVAGSGIALNQGEPGELRVSATGGGGGGDYPDMTGNKGKVLAVNDYEDGVVWRQFIGEDFLKVNYTFSTNDTGNYGTLANQFVLREDKTLRQIVAAFNPQAGSKYATAIFTVNSSGDITGSVVASEAYSPINTGAQQHRFDVSPTLLNKNTAYIMALVRTDAGGTGACRAMFISSGTREYISSDIMFGSYIGESQLVRRWYANDNPMANSVNQQSSTENGAYAIGLIFG